MDGTLLSTPHVPAALAVGTYIEKGGNVLPVSLKTRFQDLAKKLFIHSLTNLQNDFILKSRTHSEICRILAQLYRHNCY